MQLLAHYIVYYYKHRNRCIPEKNITHYDVTPVYNHNVTSISGVHISHLSL